MACSTVHEEGYATAAFGVVALAFALVAAALMALAGSQLKSARRRLDIATMDARLEGGLVLAADRIMQDARTQPFSWSGEVDGARMAFVAEPEGLKANAADPSTLGPQLLEALAGLSTAPPMPSTSMSLETRRRALREGSPHTEWRMCAQSFLSPLSASSTPTSVAPAVPDSGAANWRVGEVWRLVAFAEGRGADALVRFTGDPDNPMSVLEVRTGSMTAPDPERCFELFSQGQSQ